MVDEADGNALLATKVVGDLDGHFFVPDYQRGYRWGRPEVQRLLDDVEAAGTADYFLQPVVVKRIEDGKWELIDGQQRLTTLFLIIQYIHRTVLRAGQPRYVLEYQTRAASQVYLCELDSDDHEKNIDFFHIFQAYECIREWFEGRSNPFQAAIDFFTATSKSLKIIWYEAPEQMDSKELFRRLNVGRIPLTDAELVKAHLLSRFRSTDGPDRAHQVAAQWDVIERDLRNPELWTFATTRSPHVATHIDLLLDTMADAIAEPAWGPRPRFHTFETLRPGIQNSAKEVWDEVQDLHSLLVGWFEDRDFYHWIGYLVAIGERFARIVSLASGKSKPELAAALEARIRQRLGRSEQQVADLTYSSAEKCTEVLLLMNVESIRRRTSSSERFSFNEYASGSWSLEHIHAQNAERLRTVEQWTEWLGRHRDALRSVAMNDHLDRDALLDDIAAVLATSALTESSFRTLEQRVIRAFSDADPGTDDDMHSISNLALLSSGDNSALSNSVFEVKRREIIRRDKAGSYIPACTRDAFLKYYTETGPQQLHFWGPQDREGYLNAMLNLVGRFLVPSATP
ncbi:DUF262 domain-containing protein [Nocardia sp. A7]|uniref:DUF262 domain-containing protein n=1 Tax=Nocardia sp. A7 TaxID=2789274 RepID=UPI00397800CF